MKFHMALGQLTTVVHVGESRETSSFLWAISEALDLFGPSDIEVIDIEWKPDVDKSPLGWTLTVIFCMKGYTNGHPVFNAVFTPEF